jgi:PKD repeat protein
VTVTVSGSGGTQTVDVGPGDSETLTGVTDFDSYSISAETTSGGQSVPVEESSVKIDCVETDLEIGVDATCEGGDGTITLSNPNDVNVTVTVSGSGGTQMVEVGPGDSETLTGVSNGTFSLSAATTSGSQSVPVEETSVEIGCDVGPSGTINNIKCSDIGALRVTVDIKNVDSDSFRLRIIYTDGDVDTGRYLFSGLAGPRGDFQGTVGFSKFSLNDKPIQAVQLRTGDTSRTLLDERTGLDLLCVEEEDPDPVFVYSPQNPEPGKTVTFDASNSKDPDGNIASYEWDFQDDGTTDATGETPTHAFSSKGDYTVRLTVTDNDGATADKVRTVNVTSANEPPRVTHIASTVPRVAGSSISFIVYANDPDGTIVKYEWDFGDGSSNVTGENPTHTYSSGGTYTVTVTATDNDGATDSYSTSINVQSNKAPNAKFTFSPQNPEPGKTVTFDASNSKDPDGSIASYTWDWENDGRGGLTYQSPTAKKAFAPAGEYKVTLTVKDKNGKTDSVTKTVKVKQKQNNQKPTADISASSTKLNPGGTVTFDGSGSTDTDGSIQSYEWDFKDGNTATGQSVSHSFSSAGTYQVELTVTDDDGATDSETRKVTVKEDADSDGVVDSKDNCPNTANQGQKDTDADGTGDACDEDADGDGVVDNKDNCPDTPNQNQADTDNDGTGDACDADSG